MKIETISESVVAFLDTGKGSHVPIDWCVRILHMNVKLHMTHTPLYQATVQYYFDRSDSNNKVEVPILPHERSEDRIIAVRKAIYACADKLWTEKED